MFHWVARPADNIASFSWGHISYFYALRGEGRERVPSNIDISTDKLREWNSDKGEGVQNSKSGRNLSTVQKSNKFQEIEHSFCTTRIIKSRLELQPACCPSPNILQCTSRDQRSIHLQCAVKLNSRKMHKGPFKNDVSREGEGGGYPNSYAVRGG